MRLLGFLGRRLARLVLTVFVIASLVFFVIRVIPGDPAALIAGLDSQSADVDAIRARLGLDQPLVVQYLQWLFDTLRFDFGQSFFSNEPAMAIVLARLPLTLLLATLAFLFSILVALPLGVLSAVRKWSYLDYFGMVYSQLGMAIPSFWLGILLLLLFSVRLSWFPLFGTGSIVHFVLPAIALGVARSALLTRYVRSAMLEELGREYVVTARAMGLPPARVLYRHALVNALIPVITVAGIQFGGMLGGSIIIEQVFSLPGVGRVLLSAIRQRDFAVVQAGVVFLAIVFSGVNFVADILYSTVNPRIRVG
jgi:peptide/nickel transport system permease protein